MEPIYWTLSWIMLMWHRLWAGIGISGTWLATNWDWILTIVFLVVTVRIIIFPLFVKQVRSQRAMQALQPQLKALQEKHKGDRETLQREMMELYRREKVNPLMGCLPLLLQMPVFFGIFQILRNLTPASQPRYGWPAEQFFDAASAKLFGVTISSTFGQNPSAMLVCGILGLVMIATTYLASRQLILKTGWSDDSTQRTVQRVMLYGIPLTLIFSAVAFPLGLIIYWTTTNIISLGQQAWVLNKYPPPSSQPAGPITT
jgi:YidC/Oxa1 family membrane protein insertase